MEDTGVAAALPARRRSRLVPAAACLLLGFAVMQCIPVAPRSNPPIDARRTIFARMPVEPKAAAVMIRACGNCHSNGTQWPWYSKAAPLSWMLASHVAEGRGVMNFSDWPQDPATGVALLTGACADMSSGRMPPASYRMLHPEARVSQADAAAFCGWTKATTERIMAGTVSETRREPNN